MLNRKVLLLNASYEALGTVSVPRAVRLIWKESAELIEPDGDRILRSQHFEFPQPSVVRLIEYIDIRGRQRRSSSKRTRILARDHYRCQYCGKRGGLFDLTVDHILPAAPSSIKFQVSSMQYKVPTMPRSPLRHLDRPAFTDTPLAFVAEGRLYAKGHDAPMMLDEGEALARAMLKAIEAEREKTS
jgi:hypothetical protein